jgi:Cu+-exporting ATPase
MKQVVTEVRCYHCGDNCTDDSILSDDKVFCCTGCKVVFEFLNDNNLCSYYDLNKNPGIKNSGVTGRRFNFLDEQSIQNKLITFKKDNEVHVTFYIPSMHCSSCIWLLENFRKADPGVISSAVNFIRKEIRIVFDESQTTMRKIVEKLTQVGYEPSLQLDAIEKTEKKKENKSRIIRIGIAGFCFANIMMLSFPEYFSSGNIVDPGLKIFFSYVILILSLPVFFYSANEFFIKSYRGIRNGITSIDIPIAIGITAIFIWSAYEILFRHTAGYFDSGSGLVFFMLIGRWFQDFTFDSLMFDRDFKSYFPISVTRIRNGIEREVMVNDLKINERILIRNNEIIPVDAILLKGKANIDYKFVTGESIPVSVSEGETIFAGGKQTGSIIELRVLKEISQSNLAQLWNKGFEKKDHSGFEKLVESISKWFIVAVLLLAFSAGAYWYSSDPEKALRAFTSVLVIACPCALALSAPFTYGNILRRLGRNKIYLRNYSSLEKLADVNVIVFDKTGTLTKNDSTVIEYAGPEISADEMKIINSLVRQSSHPLSKMLAAELSSFGYYAVENFNEEPGLGISGLVNGYRVKTGSSSFTGQHSVSAGTNTRVFITIDESAKGYFTFANSYRPGIKQLVNSLQKKNYATAVLTGDNISEKENLTKLFSGQAELRFNQTPQEKLSFVKVLRSKKLNVLMIGDGLNDAGALSESDIGISITDNTNSFTPASDGIADASQLRNISKLLTYSKSAVRIIIVSFIISLLYNFVGLSFAVTGKLSPLIAAILMPISTISLVLFTVAASSIKGRILGFK